MCEQRIKIKASRAEHLDVSVLKIKKVVAQLMEGILAPAAQLQSYITPSGTIEHYTYIKSKHVTMRGFMGRRGERSVVSQENIRKELVTGQENCTALLVRYLVG